MKLYNFELWNKLKFILKIEYYKKDRIAGIFTDFFFGRNWKIQTNSKPESTWSVLSTTIKDRNPGVLSVLITTKKNCQNTFFKKPWESSFQSKFPNNSKKGNLGLWFFVDKKRIEYHKKISQIHFFLLHVKHFNFLNRFKRTNGPKFKIHQFGRIEFGKCIYFFCIFVLSVKTFVKFCRKLIWKWMTKFWPLPKVN